MSKQFNSIKICLFTLICLLPIGLKSQIQVSVTTNSPACNGYSNGDATVTATGGTAPYTYAWSNGSNGVSAYSLGAGSYKVSVTDAAAQTAVKDVVVAAPAVLSAIITAQGGSCSDITSQVGSATGGTAPYSFIWKNIATNAIIAGANLTNPVGGSYFLVVTDAKGCSANKVVNIAAPLSVTVKTADATCGGTCDGTAEAIVTGGALPYTFKWNFENKTTQSIFPLPGGTYTVSVTDANGCIKIATGTVFEPAILKANLTSNGVCTNNATATVNPSGGKAPYTVKWSNGATGVTASLIQGIYFVSVTDAAGCTASERVNVSKADPIHLMFLKQDPACGIANGTIEGCIPGGGLGPYTFQWSNGASTQVINNVGPGTYKLVVTDGAGCKDSSTITITNSTTLAINTTTTNALCGNNSGSATASVTGGNAPYTYKWSNGATTQSISNVAAGNYDVVVTDATGCSLTSQAKVTNSNDFALSLVKTDAACSGVKNGSISALASVTGAYTYKWSNGATTSSVSSLDAGTYSVVVTSAAGCSQTSTVTVNNITNLTANTTVTNSLCNSSVGGASVQVTGGTAPYTYKWSNGATTPTITGVASGNYIVSVSDAVGCTSTTQANVVNSNGFMVMFGKTDPTCNGVANGSAVAQLSGGAGNFTYKWSNGAATPTISNVAAGNYTLITTDAAGCKDTSVVSLVNKTSLNLNATAVNTLCNTSVGSVSVNTVTGGTAPYTYVWNNNATTQTVNNLPAGTYTAVVTDAIGCKATTNPLTVVANGANIVVTPSVSDATCGAKNGKVQFTFSGGTAPYSVKWSGGTNTDNLAAGSYTYTVTDATGCEKTQIVNIADKGSVKAAFTTTPTSSNAPKCDSVTYKFNNISTGATTGATYKWLFSNNATSIAQTADITFGGTVGDTRLIVTSADGCSDTSKQAFNLNVLKVDVPDTAKTCVNSDVSVLAKNNNSAFPVTYKWTPSTIVTAGATTASPTFKPTAAGATKAYVEISNALGCTVKDSVIVTAIQKVAIDTNAITFKQDCDTRKITFTNSSPIADQYRWVFGDPTNPTAGSTVINPSYTYGQGGTSYIVTLIPTMGCLDTVRKFVPVRNGVAVSLTASNDSIVCNANQLALKATSNASKIEWSTSSTFTPATVGANFNATPTGRVNTYYVRATDVNGCIATKTIVVNNFAINVTYDKLFNACVGVGKQISLTNNTPDVLSVTWTPATLIDGSNTVLNPIIKTNVDGTLNVKIANQYNCTLTDNIAVKANSVDASATIDQTVIYVDDQVSLGATPAGTGYTYKWTPSTDVVTSTSATTKASPKVDTKYIVEVSDLNGCKDTASVNVKVLTPECAEPFVFIPRAFSPNSDGINDKVYVRGEYLKEVEFAIYNRWGEQVFFTKSMEVGWDGTHKGAAVCPDVYGYYVKGICKKGETFFAKGNITVMK
jgi:gliding motility-associated-like protein